MLLGETGTLVFHNWEGEKNDYANRAAEMKASEETETKI